MSDNPEEAAYYLRFISFFIDVATETVRQVLHFLTNEDVTSHLQSSKTKKKLSDLRGKKVLNEIQYNIVSKLVPNTAIFDISLLITLILNTELLPPTKKGWGDRPDSSDLSLSADIVRLRLIRNSLLAHRPRASLHKGKYERLWKELEDGLLRIQSNIAPDTVDDLAEKITSYKTRKLDAGNEEYLQKLEAWWETCTDISKLQETVEELANRCNEFRLFFKKKPEKYSRYIRLLFDGGKLVLSSLLKTKIIDIGLDLRDLLRKHYDLLKSRIGSQDMFTQIFLAGSSDDVDLNSDTDTWDILVIVDVIEVILNPRDMRVINMIRNARINYADTALLSLHDDEHFSRCCEDLVSSIRMLASSLSDSVQDECERHINSYRSFSTETSIDFDEYLSQLKSHGVGIKDLSDLYVESMEKLKKSVQEMELAGICFKTEHVLDLKMVTLGENSEKIKLAEEVLHTTWQAALSRSGNPEEFEGVRLEVDRILEEIQKHPNVTVTEIKKNSIMISIACYSCLGLLQTVEYLTNWKFKEWLFQLSIELGNLFDCGIKIEGNVTFESILGILENGDNSTEDEERGLTVPVICTSPEGMREVLKVMGSKQTTNSVNQISDHLSVLAKETISVKLTPDPMAFIDIFDETDSETTNSIESHTDDGDYSDRYLAKEAENDTSTFQHTLQHVVDDGNGNAQKEILQFAEMQVSGKVSGKDETTVSDQDLKQELKRDLIALYRKRYATLSIENITEDIVMPFERLYVPPFPVTSVSRRPTKTKHIESLNEIFFSDREMCRNIYLTAETGMGKTAFVKWLTLLWCHANDCETISSKAVEDMKKFQFVFLVLVGEINENCDHVDEMIYENILGQLKRSCRGYSHDELENILETESCLIILDGIDELVTDSIRIPLRKERDTNTFFTTCTTWTYERLQLSATKVDTHMKIDTLENSCIEKMSENIISIFTNETSSITSEAYREMFAMRMSEQTGSANEQFKNMLHVKQIAYLVKSPVILAHLLSLWLLDEDTGQSLCDVYSNSTSLLVTRAAQKKAFKRQLSHIKRQNIEREEKCTTFNRPYNTLFTKLGLLAYKTLFSAPKQDSFEFDEFEAKRILSADTETENTDILEAGLNTGILCKRSCSRYPRKRFPISFYDETVHQYFAALYINTLEDRNVSCIIADIICTEVSPLSSFTKVIVFLAGLNPDAAKTIIQQILLHTENLKQKHRSSVTSDYLDCMKTIQDMIVGSVEECRNNALGRLELPLEDIFIDSSCENKAYRTHLKRLISVNQDNIYSLHVKVYTLPRKQRDEMLLFLEHVEFPRLQQIGIAGVSFLSGLQNFKWIRASGTLECLQLEKLFFESEHTWSILFDVLQKCGLKQLGIDNCFFTHKQLNDIVTCITGKKSMTQILLRHIKCSSHNKSPRSDPGVVLGLSSHQHLNQLELVGVPIGEAHVNVNSLEECHIGKLADGCASKILKNLEDACHLKRFTCYALSDMDDICSLTELLPKLEHLAYIDISSIDFGQITIHLPSEMELTMLRLFDVSMSVAALQEVTETIETYPQQVTVELDMCVIEPKNELETFKKYIRSSSRFVYINDTSKENYINLNIKTSPENM